MNKEEIRMKRKCWRDSNRERINQLIRLDRINDPEKYRVRERRRSKEQIRIAHERYRILHQDKIKLKKHYDRIKEKIIAFYIYSNGNMQCLLCGNSEFICLGLDHIGGGTQHRKLIAKANYNIYNLLRQQNFPDGYRLLCQNCNFTTYLDGLIIRHKIMAKCRAKLKFETLKEYADPLKCNICSVTDIRILTLDHINGDGRKELRRLGIKGGAGYYRYLRDNKYPDKENLQVLCFNHNCSKRIETPPSELIESTIREFLELQQHQKSSYRESSH
jgi:hypothetical protein